MQLVSSSPGATPRERLLPIEQVTDLVGLKKSKLYEMIREKRFPEPLRLGTRTVRWPETRVRAWVAARIAEADAAEGRVQVLVTALKAQIDSAGAAQ